MNIDRTAILVLNYNGRELLAECLPSLLAAARAAPVPCPVVVVDNGSTDASLDYLGRHWPEVDVERRPNRGLASFNDVLAERGEPVVLLLNQDVKLAADAVGPLLAPFQARSDALFSAPQCWTFDGAHYEGMRTRVRCRRGLVQGMCRVPGHLEHVDQPACTAAAGPVLAAHRERFLAMGGYDPLYFPGRIEDLDLGFRGWMAGWRGYYVPESRAWHQGFAAFEPAFGHAGCDRLALRNTLLFAWKNLRGARLLGHLAWLPARLGYALARGRLDVLRALGEAIERLGPALAARRRQLAGRADWVERQEAFFREFGW